MTTPQMKWTIVNGTWAQVWVTRQRQGNGWVERAAVGATAAQQGRAA